MEIEKTVVPSCTIPILTFGGISFHSFPRNRKLCYEESFPVVLEEIKGLGIAPVWGTAVCRAISGSRHVPPCVFVNLHSGLRRSFIICACLWHRCGLAEPY